MGPGISDLHANDSSKFHQKKTDERRPTEARCDFLSSTVNLSLPQWFVFSCIGALVLGVEADCAVTERAYVKRRPGARQVIGCLNGTGHLRHRTPAQLYLSLTTFAFLRIFSSFPTTTTTATTSLSQNATFNPSRFGSH